MRYAIRYKPDTDLGQRFTGTGPTYTSREDAVALLRFTSDPDRYEIVEVDE